MAQTTRKLDSNSTGLSIAQEAALGILPTGGYGSFTLGAVSGNADFDNIELTWNAVTKQLVIIGNVISGTTRVTCRIRRTRGTANDVGVQVSIGGASGWIGSDPAGGIAEWNIDPLVLIIPPSTVTVVADLTGFVINGDVLTIEFDTDLSFVGVASRVLTLTSIGTGVTIWQEYDPNEYDDFGAEVETVAREPINKSRQKKKGVVVDVDSSGGFSIDMTQTALQSLMQGFFFADARERVTTNALNPQNSRVVTGLTATPHVVLNSTTGILVGHLLRLSGFTTLTNNGVFRVITVVSATDLLVDGPLTVDAAPAATAKVEVVGFQTNVDTSDLVLANGVLELNNFAHNLTTLGFTVGEWVFIGGDNPIHRYTNNAPGFGRIKSIAATQLKFDEITWANPQTENASATQAIRLYFGTVIRNEDDPALIKCRSYQLERQLGNDTAGVQSEYLIGAVANEFTLNIPTTDKITADMGFVALDTELRNGSDGLKAGTRVAAPNEDAFNTSSHVYQMRLYVHNDGTVTPGSLFGFVQEVDLTINNNVEGLKAIGVVGSFDVNVGDFEVSGELNCYFATVEAVRAVRNNADVGFNIVCVRDNAGYIFDIPLVSLGGGRTDVEKDNPIMLPLEKMAAECDAGYTMLSTWFRYLPTVAMDT